MKAKQVLIHTGEKRKAKLCCVRQGLTVGRNALEKRIYSPVAISAFLTLHPSCLT